MAYAFNDDKSKAPVYTKDDYLIFTGEFSVQGQTSGNTIITDQRITDDYVVISVMQNSGGDSPTWSDSEVYNGYTYPSTLINPDVNKLIVWVFNDSTTQESSSNVKYRVVLMKIS